MALEFLIGRVMNPTTFLLNPFMAAACVTPNMTSFSFWSMCNFDRLTTYEPVNEVRFASNNVDKDA